MPPITRPLLRRTCLFKSSNPSPNLQFKRHEHSYRRHVKKLSLPPGQSFLPSTTGAPSSSHIIFNPPPTAPNVYHTPLKFLPKSDKRRQLYTTPSLPSVYTIPSSSRDAAHASPISKPGTALHETTRSIPSSLLPRIPASSPLPPSLKPITEKRYHLEPAQVEEMRQLRASDPSKWTIDVLAAKYECSTLFVRICAKNVEAGVAHRVRREAEMERWGQKKRMAREDRRRRKDLWGRDA